ncbi:arf-GAP with GTPase, ANK repeat and PH domain-containing protein 1 isoform X4 [Lates japonicus]|uniref:Arf-GAP with GTPase, ANK repeat and PH domain-containing protein 1 isoform X4 n=1 Tax=Lates japonicus TaxID=270547 RepID=A0AAD3NAH4_LATJO|nr:arf-GAP with GTPase, ANK repeat and PH domain-containing protein 1 isoform X4 [Lates japonicus]
MNYQQHLANSAAIRSEIQRFESVHPNIYSIYELLERVEEPLLQNQIREHVIAIEGEETSGLGLVSRRHDSRLSGAVGLICIAESCSRCMCPQNEINEITSVPEQVPVRSARQAHRSVCGGSSSL